MMSNSLKAAINRVHNLIREMREDGVGDADIMAALGQATAETAMTIYPDHAFGRGVVDHIFTMMERMIAR